MDTLRWRFKNQFVCNDPECDSCVQKKKDFTYEVSGSPKAIQSLWPAMFRAHENGAPLDLLEVIDKFGIHLPIVG